MTTRKEDMKPTKKSDKEVELEVRELEERIAPIKVVPGTK